MQGTILHIEDDEEERLKVQEALRAEGFDVVHAADGDTGIDLARRLQPDLILLDLLLPGRDGLEVCRELRRETTIPIMMVSVRGDEVDRVVGLEIGADDYLPKPWAPRELIARVRAMVRRARDYNRDDVVHLSGMEFDFSARTAMVAGDAVRLTPKEFDLLCYFALHPGALLSGGELMQQVWGYESPEGDPRLLDSHIERLRQKLPHGGPSFLVIGDQHITTNVVFDPNGPVNIAHAISADTIASQVAGPMIASALIEAPTQPDLDDAIDGIGSRFDELSETEQRELLSQLRAGLEAQTPVVGAGLKKWLYDVSTKAASSSFALGLKEILEELGGSLG